MYEGDSGAPKERFITLAELENAGLIKSDTKGKFAYISQVLTKDVAQKAGSTANPTITDAVKKDTSRQPRTPGGSGGGSAEFASPTKKINDSADVNLVNPAENDFMKYDGNVWAKYALFQKTNKWFGSQQFELPLRLRARDAGPEALAGLGYLWAKTGSPSTLWFTASDGTETQLGSGGGLTDIVDDLTPQLGGTLDANTFSIDMGANLITDTTVGQWDAVYAWVDPTGVTDGYVLTADGAGNAAWEVQTGGGLTDIVDDLTPQLGGTLDANTFSIDMGVNLITDTAVGQWITAYGWGDHSTAGYITGITAEPLSNLSDVTITAIASGELLKWNGSAWINNTLAEAGIAAASHTHVIANITDFTDNSSNWNTAYGWGDHASAGYTTNAAAATYIGFNDTSPSVGDSYFYKWRSHATSPPLYVRQAGAGDIARFFKSATATSTSGTDQITFTNSGGITLTGSIDLGHASDTTISRVSAGKVEIESKPIIKHASATYNSGEVTFSTSAPSGGSDGDIWYEYT